MEAGGSSTGKLCLICSELDAVCMCVEEASVWLHAWVFCFSFSFSLLLLSFLTSGRCLPLKEQLQVSFIYLISLSPITTVSESHLALSRRSKCFTLYCFLQSQNLISGVTQYLYHCPFLPPMSLEYPLQNVLNSASPFILLS